MLSWTSLPNNLQLKDRDFTSLTLGEVKDFFELAQKEHCVNDFATLFFESYSRAKASATRNNVQTLVDTLEDYKRYLGRAYARTKHRVKTLGALSLLPKMWTYAFEYNECEYQIQWLLTQYECTRHSKPYFLEVE